MIPMTTQRFRAALLAATAVAFATGCNATRSPSSPPAPGASASSAAPAAHPSVVGTVTWVPDTTRKPTGVVYVEDDVKQPGAAMTADVAIKNKDLTPFVAVVSKGGTVTFANRDALTHHVFSPELPGWDTGYLSKDQTTTKRFDTAGTYSFLCNIHPEMLSYLVVIPSTYFGRVGADGRYAIANLPPGTYRVTAWGPRMQSVTQSVTVAATGATKADFELRPLSP
jgi:plastocyanin